MVLCQKQAQNSTSSERLLSKLSDKSNIIGLKELKLWAFKDASFNVNSSEV